MSADDDLFARPAERVALVTGVASGIGEATVRRLAAAGIGKLVLVDLHDGPARRAAAALGLPAGDVLVRGQHVADEAAWRDAETAVAERFGRLDLVVASAGGTGAAHVVDSGYSL